VKSPGMTYILMGLKIILFKKSVNKLDVFTIHLDGYVLKDLNARLPSAAMLKKRSADKLDLH
jgi:hypothetical protein